MYLEFDNFLDMGGDETILKEHYLRFEAKARQIVDYLTHNRIKKADASDRPEVLKYCMHALISAMHADEAIAGVSGREVSSMSNDGVSVTYANAQNAKDHAQARYTKIIREWLSGEEVNGVNLFYAGVDA